MAKIALITGATAGFGEATAKRFVAEGYKVIITGRRQERLTALVSELGGSDIAHALCFDIRDENATKAALDSLPAPFKEINVLVNNAGLALGTSPVDECSLDDWKTMIDLSLIHI